MNAEQNAERSKHFHCERERASMIGYAHR